MEEVENLEELREMMRLACRETLEKRREQRIAWDRKHLRTVSCRVSVDVNRRLKHLCEDYYTTRYEVMRQLIETLLDMLRY